MSLMLGLAMRLRAKHKTCDNGSPSNDIPPVAAFMVKPRMENFDLAADREEQNLKVFFRSSSAL